MRDTAESAPTICTIGHSNRPIGRFVEILKAYGLLLVADVRSLPGSRAQPQFNLETLSVSLADAGIAYVHLPMLGGRRRSKGESPNTGWRNASFRAYADYMQTPEFNLGLNELIDLAERSPTAIMCAEAVPWRCHRALISDALTVRGWTVVHIDTPTRSHVHVLTPLANVNSGRITYPASQVNGADCKARPS